LIRDLLVKVGLVRYFRAAATLIEGGLPALSALEQARGSLQHSALEKSIGGALLRLSQGESLEEALQKSPLIPSLISRMLGIAQQTGTLSTMMQQIALIYEGELEKSFARITSLAQPILLLILGAMVGFVLLSVLLPLTDVSSFTN
jgi:general secretion pathway protein F/type IV pilus assembly protein PilC